jgi:iron(II)-dependent oxidoreductase
LHRRFGSQHFDFQQESFIMQNWNVWKVMSSWGVIGALVGLLGWIQSNPFLLTLGSVAAIWFVWTCYGEFIQRLRDRKNQLLTVSLHKEDDTLPPDEVTMEDLISSMTREGRYGLLLRPQIAIDLWPEQITAAKEKLFNEMGLIPSGEVELHSASISGHDQRNQDRSTTTQIEFVPSYFLDRYPITNRQYQTFVDAGGYAQTSLWDPEILPAVLEFTDSTGQPGPRWWRNGKFLSGEESFPVVGVSWYEALAYARWSGKRLPSGAQWVKAASWPVPVSATRLKQRQYPWGDCMENGRANLWDSGLGRVVSIHEFNTGANISGVHQLIGNVWEWTETDFVDPQMEEQDFENGILKSIRGGAFDTYFDHQAASQFESADNPLSRKHNVGFRCALNWDEISLGDSNEESSNGMSTEDVVSVVHHLQPVRPVNETALADEELELAITNHDAEKTDFSIAENGQWARTSQVVCETSEEGNP